MKKSTRIIVSLCLAAGMTFSSGISAYAASSVVETSVSESIRAEGVYKNWDGVSNVAQFKDKNGNFCFAYDDDDYVVVVRTNKKGNVLKKRIKLKKQHPIFGTVLSDKDGNFYVVTGEENKGSNKNKETVFISKYSSSGKHIKTVGDDGRSSLGYWYDDSFNTQLPFEGGNCAAEINGNLLSVNYARSMYSGHQSNSVFTINISTMKEVAAGIHYNSHSFAQRVTAFKNGFLYASEGDCYDRAFTISSYVNSSNTDNSKNSFHFWVPKGTFDDYDMLVLNNNFAHMGAIVNVNDKYGALVGTSVKSLNSDAKKENEQLFIQIFDPSKSLNSSSAYVTSGTRSGVSGPNGDEKVTNYGVKWLTDVGSKVKISNPQAVATKKGNIVILYEKRTSGKYYGVYYMVVNSKGEVTKKETKFTSKGHLNPCTMPVYANGKVCWAGNKTGSKTVCIYSIDVD